MRKKLVTNHVKKITWKMLLSGVANNQNIRLIFVQAFHFEGNVRLKVSRWKLHWKYKFAIGRISETISTVSRVHSQCIDRSNKRATITAIRRFEACRTGSSVIRKVRRIIFKLSRLNVRYFERLKRNTAPTVSLRHYRFPHAPPILSSAVIPPNQLLTLLSR